MNLRVLTAGCSAVVISMLIGSCGGTGATDEATSPSTTSGVEVGIEPRFADPGPYAVGVTTLTMADSRLVEVYYPVTKASAEGAPPASYLQTDPIPPDVLAGLPAVPAGTDLKVEIPAVRDVTASPEGPFPLLLFSHGAGGWRSIQGNVLSGIASWGIVVASTDYTEYGLLAQFTGSSGSDPSAKATARASTADVARATIDLLVQQSNSGSGPLSSSVDPEQIVAAGHSAGGGTMFQLLDEPRVKAIIGWAPVSPPDGVTSSTPTMIIAGTHDIAITPDVAHQSYGKLKAPKRLVMVHDLGHNGFTGTCLAIKSGTDLIGIAKSLGIPIPDRLLELGRNGCTDADLDVKTGWRVIQHFTVAEIRAVFGLDPAPVGLEAGITAGFPGVTIDYDVAS